MWYCWPASSSDSVHPSDRISAHCVQVGDGTTSVVLLAGEFLRQVKPYVEEGVHPQVIIRAVRKGTQMMIKRIQDVSVKVGDMRDQSHCVRQESRDERRAWAPITAQLRRPKAQIIIITRGGGECAVIVPCQYLSLVE